MKEPIPNYKTNIDLIVNGELIGDPDTSPQFPLIKYVFKKWKIFEILISIFIILVKFDRYLLIKDDNLKYSLDYDMNIIKNN